MITTITSTCFHAVNLILLPSVAPGEGPPGAHSGAGAGVPGQQAHEEDRQAGDGDQHKAVQLGDAQKGEGEFIVTYWLPVDDHFKV